MPRYFFHSEDACLTHDLEGTELADVAAARAEAVRFAGELMADRTETLWESSRWRLVVTDETKAILFTIEVNTVIGVAATPWRLAG